MRLCDKCFSNVLDSAMFCTECGASLGDGEVATESDSAIYPEITRANLLRMKGSYEEAEKISLGILKKLPNNATTHILLGDIHDDKGNVREALLWYEIAQELAQDNPTLQTKIKYAKEKIERTEHDIATNGLEVAPNGLGLWKFLVVAIMLVVIASGAYFFGGIRKENALKAIESKKLNDATTEPISINGEAPPQPLLPKQTPSDTITPGGENGMTEIELGMLNNVKQSIGEIAPRIVDLDLDPRTGTVIATVIGETKGTEEQDQIEVATIGKSILDSAENVSRATVKIVSASTRKVLQMGTVNRATLNAATGSPGTLQWAQSLVSEKFSEQTSVPQ